MEHTLAQLQRMDIDFSRSALHDHPVDLTMRDTAHHRHGIIFSGQNDKGELLVKFFQTIDYHPKKVIFIDDKLKYVEQVQRAMAAAEIPFIGIRYSHLDEKVKNYNVAEHDARIQQFCLEFVGPGSLVLSRNEK
jgi:hypothetical protein